MDFLSAPLNYFGLSASASSLLVPQAHLTTTLATQTPAAWVSGTPSSSGPISCIPCLVSPSTQQDCMPWLRNPSRLNFLLWWCDLTAHFWACTLLFQVRYEGPPDKLVTYHVCDCFYCTSIFFPILWDLPHYPGHIFALVFSFSKWVMMHQSAHCQDGRRTGRKYRTLTGRAFCSKDLGGIFRFLRSLFNKTS